MRRCRLLLLTLILLYGCVEEYPAFKFDSVSTYTQIDGVLSNLPGGRTVQLRTLQSNYGNTLTYPVEKARVRLLSSRSETIALTEGYRGRYTLPPTYRLTPGVTYRLEIDLPTGVQLRSAPETMPDSVAFTTELTALFTPDDVTPMGSSTKTAGHIISGGFDDPAGVTNFYRLNWKTWERQFYCRFSVNRYDPIYEALACQDAYRCATPCWQEYLNTSIALFSDRQADGRAIRNVRLADVPVYETTGYLLEAQLESITPGYYAFLQELEARVKSAGGLTDTPPVPIRGNFTASDGGQTYVGYFSVIGVGTKRLYVSREGIDFQQHPILGLLSCRLYREVYSSGARPTAPCQADPDGANGFRTPVKPAGWPN